MVSFGFGIYFVFKRAKPEPDSEPSRIVSEPTPLTQPSFITLKYILSTAIVATLAFILGRQQRVDPSSSESGFQDNQFGLLDLASGLNPTVDIVAIHGLDGHRLHSWTTENGICWLRDLLGSRVSEARILTYGYDANTRGKEQLSTQSLYSHAHSLISNLALERQATGTEERPIIFVAHSLGGIVLKNALVHAHSATKGNLYAHKAIALSTYGIIFLGTPHWHQGTQSAEFATILLNIQTITRPVNDALVKHLSRNSEALEQQLSQFVSISNDFVIKFGFETYPTYLRGGFRDLIVSRASAVVPGTVDAEAISISKNHVGMSKFSSAEDEDFKTISRHLSIMAKAAPLKIAKNWEHHRRLDGV